MLVKKFGRLIETAYASGCEEALRGVSQSNRVLAYYLSRAALAGYETALFQLCPYPEIIPAVDQLARSLPRSSESEKEFADAVDAWWIYLYANMGVHCVRESVNNKKVPWEILATSPAASAENCVLSRARLEKAGLALPEGAWSYLFDPDVSTTATVPGDIEASGTAFYAPGFTNAMYDALPPKERGCLVAYHRPASSPEGNSASVDSPQVESGRYSTADVCAASLQRVVGWLRLARQIVDNDSDMEKIQKDHLLNSLSLLERHLETGEEECFKEHSKVWLKLDHAVEYTLGFIEYYDDPMGHIGTFQADVTVQQADISPLVRLLPSFEERLPFPEEYKREDRTILPNAKPAHKVVGVGGLGPVFCTLAYCLPNYQDVRSALGSKQIMYPAPRPSDPERFLTIYCGPEERSIFEKYSSDLALRESVSALTTTLHETIGHASGRMIPGVTEKIRNERLGRYGNGQEEMRAEILALYVAMRFYDEIVESGFLGEWPARVPKDVMLRLFIQDIAGSGWKRWRGLPSGSTEITQAHAQADTAIMYYLIEHSNGEVKLLQDSIQLKEDDGSVSTLPVIHLHVGDPNKIFPVVEKLAQVVQHISSTADKDEALSFMDKYASSTRNPAYADIVTGMREANGRGVLETVNLFPEFDVVYQGEAQDLAHIVDAIPRTPTDPLVHFRYMYDLGRAPPPQ